MGDLVRINRVLAIESSCDDTSVAIVDDKGFVEALCSANQDLAHASFGGVVPEIASRNHAMSLLPLVEACLKKSERSWKDIEGIAVTSRPGLIGSLIVGVVAAKMLALIHDIPFVGVNHLEGHLLAPLLKDNEYNPPTDFLPPFLALVVSGGHTQICKVKDFGEYEILGRTIDDAAGEAFDKFGQILGLGFPGGVNVDKLAQKGKVDAFNFPRPLCKSDRLDFSFSGLKAAGLRLVQSLDQQEQEEKKSDLCASYQEAIVDCLIHKLNQASQETGIKKAIITGGVSANSRLRTRSEDWADQNGIGLIAPPLRYCTDNAAMIGYAGILRLNAGENSCQILKPLPRSQEGDFV